MREGRGCLRRDLWCVEGGAGVGAYCPGGGDPPTEEEGKFGQRLLRHSRIGTGKSFFWGGGLFVCSWNARRGTVEGRGPNGTTRGMFRANTVTLFLVWGLEEKQRD